MQTLYQANEFADVEAASIRNMTIYAEEAIMADKIAVIWEINYMRNYRRHSSDYCADPENKISQKDFPLFGNTWDSTHCSGRRTSSGKSCRSWQGLYFRGPIGGIISVEARCGWNVLWIRSLLQSFPDFCRVLENQATYRHAKTLRINGMPIFWHKCQMLNWWF